MWRQERHAQLRRQQHEQRRQQESPQRGRGQGRGRGFTRGNHGGRTRRGRGHHHVGFPRGGRGRWPMHQHGEDRLPPPASPTKPWMNFHLQTQMVLRESLQAAAQRSHDVADYEKFRLKRAEVHHLESELMRAYFRNNPEQEGFWLPLLALEASRTLHYCDMCEETFEKESDLIKHEEEHEVCGLEGCNFTASKEQLESHVLLLHASGLYSRMTNSYSKEDVEKWRSERVKNYPTLAIIEKGQLKKKEKQLQVEERQQRYLEELRDKEKFQAAQEKSLPHTTSNSSKTKKTRLRKRQRLSEKLALGETVTKRNKDRVEVFSDESEPEGWCWGVPKFGGLSRLRTNEDKESSEEGEISDEEENQMDITGSPAASESLGDPQSRSLPEEPQEESVMKPEVTAEHGDDEEEGPEEMPTLKLTKDQIFHVTDEDVSRKNVEGEQKFQPPKQSLPKRKPASSSSSPYMEIIHSDQTKFRMIRLPRRRPTLLERLLEKEIKEERSELLQCVKFIVSKGFFDGEPWPREN